MGDEGDVEAGHAVWSKGKDGVRFCAVVRPGPVVLGAMQLGTDNEYHDVAVAFANELVEVGRGLVKTSPVLGRVHTKWFDGVMATVITHERYPDDLAEEVLDKVYGLLDAKFAGVLEGEGDPNAIHAAGANPDLLSLLLSYDDHERVLRARRPSSRATPNPAATLQSKGLSVHATPPKQQGDALFRLNVVPVAHAQASNASVRQHVGWLLDLVGQGVGGMVEGWEVLVRDVEKAGETVKRLCERLSGQAEEPLKAAYVALDHHIQQLEQAMVAMAHCVHNTTKRTQGAYAKAVGNTVLSLHWICGVVDENQELQPGSELTCLHLIRHPVARRFWSTHFGDQCFMIGWLQFESAYTMMDKDGVEIPEVFSAEAVQLLLHHLDSGMQGVVHVCEFDKVTALDGLIGTVRKLLLAQHELPEPSPNEWLANTLTVTGVDIATVQTPSTLSTLHTWLSEIGQVKCVAPLPTHVGVVIEFKEGFEFSRVMASENRPQCNRTTRHGRVIAIQHPSVMTVGEAVAKMSQTPISQRVRLVLQLVHEKEKQIAEEEGMRDQINKQRLRLGAALDAHSRRRDDRDTPQIREQHKGEEKEIITRFKEKTLELTSRLEASASRFEEEQSVLARQLSSNAFRILGRAADLLLDQEPKVLAPSNEFVEFPCSLRGNILPGKLHVGTTRCFFFAQAWRGVLAKVINFQDIKILERSDFLLLIPDCIYVLTDSEDVRFESFFSREVCFRSLRDRWFAAAGHDRAKVVYESPLMARGSVFPTWSERWCVLTTFALELYEAGESSPVDVVPLHTMRLLSGFLLASAWGRERESVCVCVCVRARACVCVDTQVRSIEKTTIGRYQCMRVHGSGAEYVIGSEDSPIMDSWFRMVAGALSSHSGLNHLHHNVLLINNDQFTHTILQIDLSTRVLRLPRLPDGDLCAPFSALRSVSLGTDNMLALSLANDGRGASKDVKVYVSSERERRVLKMVLDGVAAEGKEFDLPGSLKAELAVVKSGYVQMKGDVDFLAFTRWVELTPMGDLVVSASPSATQPLQLFNMVGANLVFDGPRVVHVFFSADYHHASLTFVNETERDAWFEAITEVCSKVSLESRQLADKSKVAEAPEHPWSQALRSEGEL